MALSDADKAEIAAMIKETLSETVKASSALDVRTVGVPVDFGSLIGKKPLPVAADQCCNGCD
ncbi:hypothetical protein [Shimia sp. MMG029]|uniref:hypothetical protein n=1 Tax=Shimia sp. MMG029 TaxID=3021978 RepID=UPI0022FEC693|nr:hypothetical protein [Shimia sp. MMG029]MDA5556028.1 hypothetical protein [Shimia sp. MMG029]